MLYEVVWGIHLLTIVFLHKHSYVDYLCVS